MRIFLSWSGEKSRKLASTLKKLLEQLGFDPWMSSDALKAADHWSEAILEALETSDFCVACVTRENLQSGWMQFEAGAISKRFAILSGITASELTGPLALFKGFQLDDTFRMVKDLNDARTRRMPTNELQRIFEKHWSAIRDFDVDPVRQLFETESAVRSPYMLAAAAEVWREQLDGREDALRELIEEVRALKNENEYIGAARELIQRSSVWAVCGKKSKNNWHAFLGANQKSKRGGRRIERIFFPPDKTEKAEIHKAIEIHLESAMLVRVFPNEVSALRVYCQWNLPIGFGMTLIGESKEGSEEPEQLEAVLVHWGGDGTQASQHYGVILRHQIWTDHFYRLFTRIQGITDPEPVMAGTLQTFLANYPDYA
jgi:TIR domain